MKATTMGTFILLVVLIIGLSMLTVVTPKLITQTYAQNENKPSEKAGMTSMSNATGTSGKIPSMSTPGEKTIYIFTSEIANVASENPYTFHVKSNQTGNSTINIPSNETMLNSNITNNSSSLNNTIHEQVSPQSINGSNVPKV